MCPASETDLRWDFVVPFASSYKTDNSNSSNKTNLWIFLCAFYESGATVNCILCVFNWKWHRRHFDLKKREEKTTSTTTTTLKTRSNEKRLCLPWMRLLTVWNDAHRVQVHTKKRTNAIFSTVIRRREFGCAATGRLFFWGGPVCFYGGCCCCDCLRYAIYIELIVSSQCN